MSLGFRVVDSEIEGKTLHCGVVELENAVIALFWEGAEPKLGSTSVALPGETSTQLLGDRDQLLGRTLGTLVATRYGKMALVSTNISRGYSEAIGRALMELVKKVTEGKD